MLLETKKLHIIEEVLKTTNGDTLNEIEALFAKTLAISKVPKINIHDLSGTLSDEDYALMTAAIEEGCEQINPDDWK